MATAKLLGIIHTNTTALITNHNAASQSLPTLQLQSTKHTSSSSSVSQNKSKPPISILNWNFFKRASAAALDSLERLITTHEKKHQLPKTADPQIQLTGNFAPVEEQPVVNFLKVEGKIPDSIRGVYVRNGANPQFAPIAGHHFFDGDGMIHAVTFHKNGSVSYACRFTQTKRLIQEKSLGRPVFPKAIGELHGHSGIARLILFYARSWLGIVDHYHGTGVANAGLTFFNNRLLAMSEDDLPYEISVSESGDLRTVGRYDFDGEVNSAMIAHPKIDPVSGDIFALSCDVIRRPYLKYFRFDKHGARFNDVKIHLAEPTMMHDFAITENFVVIPDQQVVFKLFEMIRGGSPVLYEQKKMSRFGILKKNATDRDEIRWIEVPDCFCFHFWNAWEERSSNCDEIVVIGSVMSPADSIFKESEETLNSVLSVIRLNLRTNQSIRHPIVPDCINLEVGMVNRNKLGRKTRYAFLAIADPWPKVSGFAKVDLESGVVEKYPYGKDRYGGEPFFLPANSSTAGNEDDGYILSFVHDEREWRSELQIVNATDLTLEASVKIPSRVPYGFHGTFLSSEEEM